MNIYEWTYKCPLHMCVCVCVFVCACVCVCTCMHVYLCVHVHMLMNLIQMVEGHMCIWPHKKPDRGHSPFIKECCQKHLNPARSDWPEQTCTRPKSALTNILLLLLLLLLIMSIDQTGVYILIYKFTTGCYVYKLLLLIVTRLSSKQSRVQNIYIN